MFRSIFAKKVFSHCPRCHSSINQKHNIGKINVCKSCHWAGSHSSEYHDHWLQLKSSSVIIISGLVMTTAIYLMANSHVI